MTALEEAITTPVPIAKKALYTIAKPILAVIPVDTAQEIQVGERIYRVIASRTQGQLDLPGPDLNYLRAVGARLARRTRRRDITFTFHLVETSDLNAFAHAGGHVYLFRGLFSRLRNEAQLAALLGHEMAHVDLTHTQDFVRPVAGVRQLQRAIPGASVDLARMITGLAKIAMFFTYSEPKELEADALGMRLAFEAFYDPKEAISLYQEVQSHGPRIEQSDATSSIVRSHPKSAARIAAMKKNVEDLIESSPYAPRVLGMEAFRKRHAIGD